jgi:signal transduction histidine kinase
MNASCALRGQADDDELTDASAASRFRAVGGRVGLLLLVVLAAVLVADAVHPLIAENAWVRSTLAAFQGFAGIAGVGGMWLQFRRHATYQSAVGMIGAALLTVVGLTFEAGSTTAAIHHGSQFSAVPLVVLTAVGSGCLLGSISGSKVNAVVGRGYVALAAALAAASAMELLWGPGGRSGGHAASFGLRAATLGVLAFGLLTELTRSQRLVAEEAIASERARLARELHDGLCQDLSFIAAYAERLAPTGEGDNPIAVAARSALAVSRGLLTDLSSGDTTDVREALAAMADELAGRYGISVAVNAVGAEIATDDLENLVRIAREAIVNAARHGQARHVRVTLARVEGRLTLRVTDDGRGMPAPADLIEGFGMKTMRARAIDMGGHVEVRTPPGGGTELEVALW